MAELFIRRKCFLVVILTAACDRHRPHWTSLCCVKMSALNLNLLVRSNNAPLHPAVQSEIYPCPRSSSSIASLYPQYVAVQYLCIYLCCYLINIIYCIRTRFALQRMSSSKDKRLMWQISFAQTDRSTSGVGILSAFGDLYSQSPATFVIIYNSRSYRERKTVAPEPCGHKGSLSSFICVKELVGCCFCVFGLSVDCKCKEQFHDLPIYSCRWLISWVIRLLNVSFDSSFLLLPVINEKLYRCPKKQVTQSKFTVLFYTPQATLTKIWWSIRGII